MLARIIITPYPYFANWLVLVDMCAYLSGPLSNLIVQVSHYHSITLPFVLISFQGIGVRSLRSARHQSAMATRELRGFCRESWPAKLAPSLASDSPILGRFLASRWLPAVFPYWPLSPASYLCNWPSTTSRFGLASLLSYVDPGRWFPLHSPSLYTFLIPLFWQYSAYAYLATLLSMNFCFDLLLLT